jgi:ATP-dependent Lon protease
MNPVIFFDEADKISESKTGQEIVGILIHLTDHTQNNQYYDRYFDGLALDLSRALIIFSFNDVERLCPILRDRMTVVHTGAFSTKDKCAIVQRHILPAVLKNTGFGGEDIVMHDEDVKFMIQTVPEEKGARNLKRGIEKAVMKINVLRLTGGSLYDHNRNTRSASGYTAPNIPDQKEKDDKRDQRRRVKRDTQPVPVSDLPYSIPNLRFPFRLEPAYIRKLVPVTKRDTVAAFMYM